MIKRFFRLSGEKIAIDFVISLAVVFFIFFNHPVFKDIFLSRTIGRQILDVALNTLIFMVFLYPLSCLIVFLINRRMLSHVPVPPRRKSKKKKR